MLNYLIKENTSRQSDLIGRCLTVSFHDSEKAYIQSLGGFFRPTASKTGGMRTGVLMFANREQADAVLRTPRPAGITIKPKGRPDWQLDPLKLVISGIPLHAEESDVKSLFPKAVQTIVRDVRPFNFQIGSDRDYQEMIGKEAVVRFDSEEECAASFKASAGLKILDQEVIVTFGKKNKKLKKQRRKKQRKTRPTRRMEVKKDK